LVFGDGRAMDALRKIVLNNDEEIGLRRSALQTLVDNPSEGLREICTKVLNDPRMNVVAAQGLSTFDDVEIGRQLVAAYGRFRSPERPKLIAMMVTRPKFVEALLDAVEAKKIPPNAISAFDVRQIRTLGNETLNDRVAELWGDVRQTPEDKKNRIEQLKRMLNAEALAASDKSHGRALFAKTCMQCHRMYGAGEMVGPELTGSNRNNLDYLLENMVDPSAVVGKDFRMTVVLLDDGRVINGLVTAQNERTLTIQTQTERQTIDRDTIENLKVTNLSPMPEGLLDNLDDTAIRDLIGYLMHPSQVPLPKSGLAD
jgi:putative heme-binding domain-containing protein